jgi:hypothetical protein
MRPSNHRPLALESLEHRQMLAGNVTVSLVGGSMFVAGDDDSNQIAITAGTEAGSFNVRGLDGTTVTMAGSSTPAPDTGLVVTGVRGHVNVRMAAGDDAVEVSDIEHRRGLSIETGAGNDTVNVHDVKLGGFLNIATGIGDDAVTVGSASTPAAALASDSAANVRAALAIDIFLGDGADSAQVNGAAAPAIIAGGGSGADIVGVHSIRAASLVVRGGDGDGVDQVDVSGAKAIAAVIGTGGGADRVGIVDSAFTSLNVAMGSGDDALSLQKVKARISLLAGGEGSADQLTDAGENTLGIKVITGFEIPDGVNTPRVLPRASGLLANLLNRLFR